MMEERIGYDHDKLMQVVKHRGYITDRSVGQVVSRLFGISLTAAMSRVYGTTRWNFEETFVVASYFEMTPKEYCDTFLNGLFAESREGHYVCSVNDPGRVLRQRQERNRRRKMKKQQEKEEREQIVRTIEEMEGEV